MQAFIKDLSYKILISIISSQIVVKLKYLIQKIKKLSTPTSITSHEIIIEQTTITKIVTKTHKIN